MEKMRDDIPLELTLQMGRSLHAAFILDLRMPTLFYRPVSQCPGELRGLLERASYMLSIAASSLADIPITDTDKPGFRRYIKRSPIGVIFVITPWKYVSPPHTFRSFT
jgi:acyl-CoA reductase-like NAD-dependent aldehyde dehydrogenase